MLEHQVCILILIPLKCFLFAGYRYVKGYSRAAMLCTLDISITCKGFIIKGNKNQSVSNSRRFCKGDFQPSTCIGILFERLRYRFICIMRS